MVISEIEIRLTIDDSVLLIIVIIDDLHGYI